MRLVSAYRYQLKPVLIVLGLLFCGSGPAQALSADTLGVADIFSDHMVLQRDQPVKVWGTATPQEQILVKLGGREYETITDQSGKWMVNLQRMDAGGPHSMEITAGQQRITFRDIYFGDVWLAAGQSNMAFRLRSAADPEKEKLISTIGKHNIRTYEVAKIVGGGKLLNATDKPWQQADPANVEDWSAVALYFAKGLNEHLNVPIGIINCNQGGSRIEAWMSGEALKQTAVPAKKFEGIFSHYQASEVLYKSMLSDIIPFTLKGVLWYQGESNAEEADAYQKLLPAMIGQWRTEFGQRDLPFLVAQLPGFDRKSDTTHELWANFRQAQETATASLPHTGLVVLIDAGDKDDIHPTNKKVVGERFVLAARAVAYGEDLDYSGPTLKKVTYNGKKAIVVFGHAKDGLVLNDKGESGFFVRDETGTWYPASASIQKTSVEVSHPEVEEVTGVRYGWANAPDVAFYDRSGLPAAPFSHLKGSK